MTPFQRVKAELRFANIDLAKAAKEAAELRAALSVSERERREWERLANVRAARIVELEQGR